MFVGTDVCLGVDSAVNNIMGCMDHIRSWDSSGVTTNAQIPIVVTLDGILTDVKLVHEANALFPIVVTPSCIETLLIEVL